MGTIELPIAREVSISDRYRLEEGTMLLSGAQAALRIIFDRMRADRAAGRRTGTMFSGYQGSPLGGLDTDMARQRRLREELDVVQRPGLNEELAATSVWGSQVVPALPGATVEGVLGVWYGKAPGVDRAGDALRHGSLVGAHPLGGLLALAGDDPGCKSSMLPSSSESILAALTMPVFAPGSPQEVLDLGRHAIACSRASGTWSSLKIVANVADAVATVDVSTSRFAPVDVSIEHDGRRYVHAPHGGIAPPASIEMERTLNGPRLDLVRAYTRANGLNRISGATGSARVGLVASGFVFHELREALHALGLDDAALDRLGVRILQLGVVWPLEPSAVAEFAEGLDEIVVIEEKRSFVEGLLREALYGHADAPRILGKRDRDGQPLVPAHGALDVDAIATALRAVLPLEAEAGARERLEVLRRPAPTPVDGAPVRTPFFCSGCPHNRSTDAPDSALVGVGIGCHAMVALSPGGKGRLTGVVQMGGEGAAWIGQAPFLETPHTFQNLGDGTFAHSGSLAVRAAIAAGVNITYKLLYNKAVAMTGGQAIEGGMSVAALTRWFEAEGVKRVVITLDDPKRYRGVGLSTIASVRPRTDLPAIHDELAAVEGVTLLIHDQACAAELRRIRKKDPTLEPAKRAYINQRVCEGCGDCGRKSHCLSVVPISTEFGTKTEIHQASCNKDYSCIEGDCPSFLEVIPGKAAAHVVPPPPTGLPEVPHVDAPDTLLRLIGIGGTGVVTVAQIIGMAAMLDGNRTIGLDQTGVAQKGGPVVSDVRIVAGTDERGARAARATIDGYIGFDLLGAIHPANLVLADPERTVAVVSTSQAPTGQMIGAVDARYAEVGQATAAIDQHTVAEDNIYFDASALSERLFGGHMSVNALMLGAAWQHGLIPVTLKGMQEAFRLNGVAIEMNLAAFDWGRACVVQPAALEPYLERPAGTSSRPDRKAESLIARSEAPAGSELERLLNVRVPELIAYQSISYARSYAELVGHVAFAEREAGGDGRVAEAAARGLYKLMAYKDEYEIARLHLDPVEIARREREFGAGARVRYLLHPPALKALGLKRKIALGRWFDGGFRALRVLRRLRGTWLDPFGYAEVRKVERELIADYRLVVEQILDRVSDNPETVAAVLDLPDMVRGYEDVKLESVARYRAEQAQLLKALEVTTGDQPA